VSALRSRPIADLPGAAEAAIQTLNQDCFCFPMDSDALAVALDSEFGQPGLSALVRERCPFVFAAQPVFVAPAHARRMAAVVRAVESVVAMPAFREQVLDSAPAIARAGVTGPLGVFFGYDFHLDAQGQLGLIEINTNAGGAMLNAALARAQRACCPAMAGLVPTAAHVAAFEAGDRLPCSATNGAWPAIRTPLASVAIVDDAPAGAVPVPRVPAVPAAVCPAWHPRRDCCTAGAAMAWRAPVARRPAHRSRLQPPDRFLPGARRHCCAARGSCGAGAIVLTPHPQAHALLADKRHLALFSDPARLQTLGVPRETRDILLAHVPHTEVLNPVDADRLWAARRSLFFKPVAGYGGRAAYRGDKLTRRVWQEILQADYVAQAVVLPGQRVVHEQGTAQAMKFDLRAYSYAGAVQWLAARLYQGQTTNFRTPGGGFAPVYSSFDADQATPS
jgi:hypothetical protein